MEKRIGFMAFSLLLILLVVGAPWRIFAQAATGFTKINSAPVATTTFTTGTLVNGTVYSFEITAVNIAGESKPSNVISLVIPPTGTHTVSLSWTTSLGADSYNVYDQQVTSPNPPGALTGVVN